MYVSTMAADTTIATLIDQPSISDRTGPRANRFTPPISTVATANESALNRCASRPYGRRRYSATERTFDPY